MKNFGKMLSILFLVFLLGVIAGCDTPGEITLDTPTNVTITDGVVTWNAVADATEYRVIIGLQTHTVTTPTFDLKTLSLAIGTHQVSVVAVKGTSISVPSQLVNYVVSSVEPTELSAPANVTINNGIINWTAVTNALGYIVVVNGVNHSTTQTTFDLKTITLPEGTYTVTVKATRNTLQSPASSAASYTVLPAASEEDIYEAVLLIVDYNYVPNMTEDDFEDEWEFNEYRKMARMLQMYADTAVSLSMSYENAVGLFAHIYDMPDRMESVNNATALKAELDTYGDFGLTPQSLTTMLMQLATVALEIGEEDNTENKAEAVADLADAQAQMNTLKTSVAYTTLYNKLAGYAGANVSVLNDFLDFSTHMNDWSFDYYNTLYVISEMAYDLIYNPEYHYPWYLYEGNQYYEMFYGIVVAAKTANDTAFLNQLNTNAYGLFQPFSDVYDSYNEINYLTRRIADYDRSLTMILNMVTLMDVEYNLLSQTVESVIQYLVDMYGSIPLTMITRLDTLVASGELSMAEYLLLKNEIVAVLQDNLPTAIDFALMYQTMFHIAGAMTDVNMTTMLTHANTIGQFDFLTIGLMLDMIADIDLTMINEISAIVDGLIIPGEYIDYGWYGYYEDDQVHFPKAIELAVYIGTYFENFKLSHVAQFAALEALPMDNVIEDMLKIMANIAKTQMSYEMSEEEYEIAAFIIDELVADYDNIMAGIQVLTNIGYNVYDEFITSEGQFMLDVYELIMTMDVEMDIELLISEIERIFGGFAAYNSAIFGQLDQTEIETLLRVVRVPLMIPILQNQVMAIEDYELLFEDLVTPISTVLANVISIEKQIIGVIDDSELVTFFAPIFEEDPFLEESFMIRMMAIIVIVADESLSTVFEDMIYASLTTVFDDILGHADVMTLTGMDQTQLDDMYNMIYEVIETKIMDIRTVALYDFDDLDQIQIETLMGIFDFMISN
jgi:hypothetical protein